MMKRFSWLLLGGLLALGYGFVREYPQPRWLALFNRLPQADSGESESAETEPQPAAPQPATQSMLKVVSPLAAWMGKDESEQPRQEHSAPGKPHPSDHIAGSPVGSTNTILDRTFAVSTLIKVPFEIPAHAATPHLHGTFRSFVQRAGAQSDDDSANVDFLVLNQQQYTELANGRPSEALFSADATHDQEVNLGLPVSQAEPQKYYLLFRNSSRKEGKKIVEAKFTVDF
jgi:hypothetical protein